MFIIQPNLAQCQDFDLQITKCSLIYFVRSVMKISPLFRCFLFGLQGRKKNSLFF